MRHYLSNALDERFVSEWNIDSLIAALLLNESLVGVGGKHTQRCCKLAFVCLC